MVDSYLLHRSGIKLLQHALFLLLELSHRFRKCGFHPLMQMGLHSKDATFHMFEMHAAEVRNTDTSTEPQLCDDREHIHMVGRVNTYLCSISWARVRSSAARLSTSLLC